MDENHQSRVSDAAATRKRRSSILKSQRPPRTPFSELEFNVATPTDTTKSRRVSFSRRTGVAEFVTNEATTTWKNFYEEHNKSLELSGNESGANAGRHPVGHIGQTMFDRQFQDVEAVDFITSLDNLACRNVNTSLNNFTNQLAAIEGTGDDGNLAAPQNNYELSALTEQQSKFFGDDLAIPIMGEMSGRINVNFSAMQNIDDDLDKIKRDLQTGQSNIVGPQHFRSNRDQSEYIEVEFNSTHVGLRNEELDMSITETIQSPKVQDVSKINISGDKKAHINNDLDIDKENICIPDIEAKLEDFYEMDYLNTDTSVTSAVPSKVAENPENDPEGTKTIEFYKKSENRKSIIFDDEIRNLPSEIHVSRVQVKSNTHDSNPFGEINFNADSMKKNEELTTTRRRTIVYERDDIDADMSVTAAIPQNIYEDSKKSEKRNTILFGFENADMSITMASPKKSTQDATKQVKRQTIVFDDEMADISMTNPIPAKLLSDHKEILRKSTSEVINLTSDNKQNKRYTIMFEGEMADISMTKPIPAQLLSALKEASSKSTTEDINLTSNHKQDKRQTIVFDDEMANLSMTKPISAKLLSDYKEMLRKSTNEDINLTSENKQGKRHTIVFDDEMADISMTKPIPTKLLSDLKEVLTKSTTDDINLLSNDKQDKRHTIVFDDEMADLSMTKPISKHLLSVHKETLSKSISDYKEMLRKSTNEDINLTSENKQGKRHTIVFDDEMADISMTKPIPTKLLSDLKEVLTKSTTDDMNLPSNIQDKTTDKQDKRHTIVFDDEMADLSMTKPISKHLLSVHKEMLSKSSSRDLNLTSHNKDCDTTEDINLTSNNKPAKRHTIVFDDDEADISMTKPINTKLLSNHQEILKKSTTEDINLTCDNKQCERQTLVFNDKMADISTIKQIPTKLLSAHEVLNKSTYEDKLTSNNKQGENRIIVFDDVMLDLSAKPVSAQLSSMYNEKLNKSISANVNSTSHNEDGKLKTFVFDDEMADISMTKPIPPKLISDLKEVLTKSTTDDINLPSNIQDKTTDKQDKRHTIVFDDEMAELSMTKPISKHLLPVHKEMLSKSSSRDLNLTSHNKDCDTTEDINLTSNNKPAKRHTIVFDDDDEADISMTKPINTKLLSNHQEILKKSTTEDINLTCDNKQCERQTLVFNDKMADISTTKPIPTKLLSAHEVLNKSTYEDKLTSNNKQGENLSIVFDDVMLDLSAKPISAQLSSMYNEKLSKSISANVNLTSQNEGGKRKTFEFDDVMADISVTKPVSAKLLSVHKVSNSAAGYITSTCENKESVCEKNISYVNQSAFAVQVTTTQSSHKLTDKIETTTNHTINNDEMDISITDVINIPKVEDKLRNDTLVTECGMLTGLETKTIKDTDIGLSILDRQDADMSIKVTVQQENKENLMLPQKRNTLIFDDELNNITITKPIPSKLLFIENETLNKSSGDLINLTRDIKKSAYQDVVVNPLVFNAVTIPQNPGIDEEEIVTQTDLVRDEEMDMSVADVIDVPKVKKVQKDHSIIANIGVDTKNAIERIMSKSQGKLQKQDEVSIKETKLAIINKNIVVCKVLTEENPEVKVPPYLKNVSEEIKSLMNDLVKPMADVMPFTSTLDDNLKKRPTTCNTEAQANLITSSQIDLSNQLDEKSDTVYDDNRSLISSKNEVGCGTDLAQNVISSLDSPSDKSRVDVFNLKEISFRPQRVLPEKTVPGGDLIFDYDNPLNNVRLVPLHNTEVHKYNPTRSSDTLYGSEHSVSVQCAMGTEAQNVSIHFGNEKTDVNNVMLSNTQSLLSNVSKSGSIDQSIDAKMVEVKDSEVNTLIVMKENTELLQASSSLTLVDDDLDDDRFEVEIDTQTTNSRVGVSENKTSPVRVINKITSEEISNQNDYDMTNDEEMNAPQNTSKSKKRNYSPTKREQSKNSSESNLEVTPKLISKMQKMSNSPNRSKNVSGVHFDDRISSNEEIDLDNVTSAKDLKKSPQKSKVSKKPGTSITVQQLMTEYNINANINEKMLNQKILEALNRSDSSLVQNKNSQSDVSGIQSPDLMSFTSSKNQIDVKESGESESNISNVVPTEIDSSISRLSESESSFNVVAKINMLPFMGSHECEWESSGLDSWSFRLLHARLRLLVRLEHRHHNAARTRVRADTPVRDVSVERVHRTEDTNPVAAPCIKFAGEAVQQLCTSCQLAGDVPTLLRSAANVGRLARCWGNSMHRARMHLAYKFVDKGRGLKLNVANIPLRCVWEVRMRLEMVSEPKESVPWPRACDVQAKSVLTDEVVPEGEIQRVLARVQPGWDHVPSTVWQIFKHLKNKTHDNQFLGI